MKNISHVFGHDLLRAELSSKFKTFDNWSRKNLDISHSVLEGRIVVHANKDRHWSFQTSGLL